MRRFLVVSCVALTASWLWAVPALAQQKPIIQEVEDAQGVKGLKAAFTVEQPRDVVFGLLNDLDAFPKLFPNILELKVVARDGDSADIYYKVDAVLDEAEYTLRRTVKRGPKADRIAWDLLSGDPLVVRGSWTITDGDAPGTTKLLYQSYVDVAAYVPTSMVRDTAIGKVEEMVQRIRTFSAQRATAKPAP
jgi:hypothetical protein